MTVTALRPGRTRALVQRPRRRMHFASIAPGDPMWVTICDRDVIADGAAFWTIDAATAGEEHADVMCRDCYRMLLVAATLTTWTMTARREAHA